MTRPTIYTVAEAAGVSISTVSLVFNRPHKVRSATRDQVVAAAQRLGYRPPARSEGARSQSPTVAVAAPFSSVPSVSLRLGGLLAKLSDFGADVLVHDVAAPNLSEAPLLSALPFRGGIDGVVVMGVPLAEPTETRLVESQTPCVVVDAVSRQLPSVTVDDEYAGHQVGIHLAEQGHRTVAFVHDQQRSGEYVSAGMLRLGGLNTGLTEVLGRGAGSSGSEPEVTLHALPDDGDPATARKVVERALASGCTAVFAQHDALAARVLGALRTLDVRVPDDLAVVGCDDGPLAEALDLTTVRQPFAESGRLAAELLMTLLGGDAPLLRSVTLQAPLVVRGSTSGPSRVSSRGSRPAG